MTTLPQPGTLGSSYTALYDAWNRMTSVNASGTQVAQYQYDGQGRRIVKKTYTGDTLTETRHFYWSNQWQDLEERLSASTSADKQQVWGIRYVDDLVCRDDATPQRLYVTQDANFNLTTLIDASASVKQRFIYESYGMSTVLSAAWASTTDAYAWGWRHQGLMQDTETSVIYDRMRYLHSMLGTFLQRDAEEYMDGNNLYQIEKSSPPNCFDPMGLGAAPTSYVGQPCCLVWVPTWKSAGYESVDECEDAILAEYSCGWKLAAAGPAIAIPSLYTAGPTTPLTGAGGVASAGAGAITATVVGVVGWGLMWY
jgi:RHS repeat-associated protein